MVLSRYHRYLLGTLTLTRTVLPSCLPIYPHPILPFHISQLSRSPSVPVTGDPFKISVHTEVPHFHAAIRRPREIRHTCFQLSLSSLGTYKPHWHKSSWHSVYRSLPSGFSYDGFLRDHSSPTRVFALRDTESYPLAKWQCAVWPHKKREHATYPVLFRSLSPWRVLLYSMHRCRS